MVREFDRPGVVIPPVIKGPYPDGLTPDELNKILRQLGIKLPKVVEYQSPQSQPITPNK